MIAILGDLHFTTHKDYFKKTIENILDWFVSWKNNSPENELILAGDLLHSAVNGGLVLSMLERLIDSSKFSKIHIIPGNHDIKWKDGFPQLAYEFLRERPNVVIYDRITEVELQGNKILLMPHFIAGKDELDMPSSYGSAFKKFTGKYDMVVGHFMDQAAAIPGAEGIANLRKIKSTYYCLGHVHTRIDPSIYIGSLYANKVNENDSSRSAWLLSGGVKREEKLPVFIEFLTAKYDEALPSSDALVKVYTITNCRSEALVRSKYGNIFIRKVVQDLSLSVSGDSKDSTDDDANLSVKDHFKNFLKSKGPIDRNLAKLCLSKI